MACGSGWWRIIALIQCCALRSSELASCSWECVTRLQVSPGRWQVNFWCFADWAQAHGAAWPLYDEQCLSFSYVAGVCPGSILSRKGICLQHRYPLPWQSVCFDHTLENALDVSVVVLEEEAWPTSAENAGFVTSLAACGRLQKHCQGKKFISS